MPSSPLLHPWSDGALRPDASPPAEIELASSGGKTRDGTPYRPVVFEASNVWLTPSGGGSVFDLTVDAGRGIGSAAQTRLSFDLTGDGNWDRVETYRYFATDPLPGPEHYTEAVGLLSSEGKLGEMRGGVVRVEVWSALGEGISVVLQDSSFSLPFDS
ncbi:hypothetical protein ACVBEQ_27705 [Nakamurella sp. GG22]